jgi:hypothetical protein
MNTMLKNYSVAIVRIVGNELPPRHKSGSNLEQLQFILEHEPSHPKVKKIWLLNRIIDATQEKAMIAILQKHRCDYVSLPFDIAQYRDFVLSKGHTLPYSWYRRRSRELLAKAAFIIEINRARNKAMEIGTKYADWVMPLDGGCCLDTMSMALMLETITRAEREAYALPMYRLIDNAHYADFNPKHYPMHESMLLFKHTLQEPFDKNIPYGKGEKLKAMFRLFPRSAMKRTAYASFVNDPRYHAGYVIRLSSGNDEAEGKYRKRVKLRFEGLSRLVQSANLLAGC